MEINLSPGATNDHLEMVLKAIAQLLPAPLRTPWVTGSDFQSIRPGTWEMTFSAETWSSQGTPLFLGLLRLERDPANEVWFVLGAVAADAGYRISVRASDQWLTVHTV